MECAETDREAGVHRGEGGIILQHSPLQSSYLLSFLTRVAGHAIFRSHCVCVCGVWLLPFMRGVTRELLWQFGLHSLLRRRSTRSMFLFMHAKCSGVQPVS